GCGYSLEGLVLGTVEIVALNTRADGDRELFAGDASHTLGGEVLYVVVEVVCAEGLVARIDAFVADPCAPVVRLVFGRGLDCTVNGCGAVRRSETQRSG